MVSTAPQIHDITTDELRNVSVDMSASLDTDELLTGTPEIQSSVDLTVTNVQINSTPIDINGSVVAAGKAVQFQVESAVAKQYRVEILCDTDAGQVVEGRIRLIVERSQY